MPLVRPDEEVTVILSGEVRTLPRRDAVDWLTRLETESAGRTRHGIQLALADLYLGETMASDIH